LTGSAGKEKMTKQTQYGLCLQHGESKTNPNKPILGVRKWVTVSVDAGTALQS
jgi:hypothetical protein